MWELLMLAILVALTLWVLAARGTPWHVYLSVWVSWGMALALVALVPIDLHIVYLKRCIDHYGDDVEAQVNTNVHHRTHTHTRARCAHARRHNNISTIECTPQKQKTV